jgi:hypothetical protein
MLSKKRPAILTDSGATTWLTDTKELRNSRSKNFRPLSVGDKRLRLSVLFACVMEAAFIVFLTVFRPQIKRMLNYRAVIVMRTPGGTLAPESIMIVWED